MLKPFTIYSSHMRNLTITCDRCEKTILDLEELFTFSLNLKSNSGYNTTHESRVNNIEYCRECLIKSGLVTWKTKLQSPPSPPSSIEDLIKELVEHAVTAAIQNQ